MYHLVLRSSFVTLFFLIVAAGGLAQQSAEEYLARGKEQLTRKEYLQAAASFEAAVKLRPDLAEAYYYRGQLQQDRGQADADYTKAIELKPDYFEAYFQRGLNSELGGNPKGAMRDYSRAIELNPRFTNAYMTRAVLYLLDNKGALAIADYTKVIELKPDGDSYYVRGNSYLDLGQYESAVRDLTRSIELDGSYYWAYKQRAKAYTHLKRFQLAQADERKAAEIGPPK
jgi:tetratricopeptide (TPR) repeat protein